MEEYVVKTEAEKPTPTQKHLGALCDVCGDVGHTFLLKTCSSCQKTREHIYCMRNNLLSIPKIWYCEACRPPNRDFRTSAQPNLFEKISHENKEPNCSSLSNVAHHNTCRSVAPHRFDEEVHALSKKLASTGNGSKGLDISKKTVRAKVKYLPVEDIYRASSGPKTVSSSAMGGFGAETTRTAIVSPSAAPHSSHQKTHGSKSPGNLKTLLLGSTQITPNLERQPSKPWHGQNSPAHVPSKFFSSESSRKRKIAEGNALGKSSSSNVLPLTKAKRSDSEVHQSPSNQIGLLVSSVKGKSARRELQGSDKCAGKEVSLVLNNYIKEKNYFDPFKHPSEDGKPTNPPAIEAAWKGNIEIRDTPEALDDFYDGFKAHHPQKISQKAYEFSKGMPGTLQFMLRSRSDVWLEIFRQGLPSGYDIALYFFPGDFYRSTKKYESLHKLIETHDLCLQSCIGSVDLLIFTSQQLPADFQRLNRHFYLWGVFRSMKRRVTSVPLKENVPLLKYGNRLDSQIAINESDGQLVDMVGGKDVGKGHKSIRLTFSDHSYERGVRSNSVGAHTNCDRNKSSQDSSSKLHSDRTIEKATTAQLGVMVKREQQDDLDAPPGYWKPLTAPPGFLRPFTVEAAQKGPVQKSLDAPFTPPGFSRPVAGGADQKVPVENLLNVPAYGGLLDAPPGFSAPVTGSATPYGLMQKSHVKMEPVPNTSDVPPGFSKSVEHDERDLLSEVHTSLRRCGWIL